MATGRTPFGRGPSSSHRSPHVGDSPTKVDLFSNPSCETCRLRKVKCDRARPACSWCSRNQRPCVYKERRKIGKENEATLELESKVQDLDAFVNKLSQRVEDHIMYHDGSHSSTYGDPSPQPLFQEGPPDQIPIQNRQVESAETFYPSSLRSAQLLAESFSHHHSGDDTNDEADVLRKSLEQRPFVKSAVEPNGEFPPHDVLYTLVDLFFKHINTWLPLLERKETFCTYFGSTTISDEDKLVLHAIVALTLRFSTDSRLSTELRQWHYQESRRQIELRAMNCDGIHALKALTLLCLDSFGDTPGPSAWNTLSVVAHAIVRLGLCTERSNFMALQQDLQIHAAMSSWRLTIPEPKSWLEDEGNRRLCWVVYLLDRYATADTPFDFTLPESSMHRWLPCRYDLWSENVPVQTAVPGEILGRATAGSSRNHLDNLGSFSLHCNLLHMMTRISKFVEAPLDISSEREVQAWKESFAGFEAELSSGLQMLSGAQVNKSLLCHSDPGARTVNWIMLHGAFVTASIRLNSVAAYPAVRSRIFAPIMPRAVQACLSATETLANITMEVLESDNMSLLGPHFAFALWTAARLLIVHASSMGSDIEPKIDTFIHALAQMGRYWPIASTYSDLLKRVTDENKQATDMTLANRRQHANLVSLKHRSTVADCTPGNPIFTQELSFTELDFLEVFEFFNYPRPKNMDTSTSLSYNPTESSVEMGLDSMYFDMEVPDVDLELSNTDFLSYL